MKALDRWAALSGAVSGVLLTVGNDVLGQPPGEQSMHPSGVQDLANLNWLAASTPAQIGIALELFSFCLFVVFVGYLAARLRDAGWLATTALAGGVLYVAVKLSSGAPLFAAYLLRDEITPRTARVLFDMNGAAFLLSWLPMGVFVGCAAGAALVTGVLGRVLGWGGVVAGSATILVTAATGVHMLSAIFVPYLLCGLWVLLASLRLGLRRASDVSASAPARTTPVVT